MLTPYSGHVDPPGGKVRWERAFGVLKIGGLVCFGSFFSSHRFTFEFHPVRIGCQSVKYGIGHRVLLDVFMSFGSGELRDDNDRLSAVSVFEDLQKRQA